VSKTLVSSFWLTADERRDDRVASQQWIYKLPERTHKLSESSQNLSNGFDNYQFRDNYSWKFIKQKSQIRIHYGSQFMTKIRAPSLIDSGGWDNRVLWSIFGELWVELHTHALREMFCHWNLIDWSARKVVYMGVWRMDCNLLWWSSTFHGFIGDKSREQSLIENLTNLWHLLIRVSIIFTLADVKKELNIWRLHAIKGCLVDIVSARLIWWTPIAKMKKIIRIESLLRFEHSVELIEIDLKGDNVFFDGGRYSQMAYFNPMHCDMALHRNDRRYKWIFLCFPCFSLR
jgi:hypothetical protein